MKTTRLPLSLITAACFALGTSTGWALTYDEGISGDLSDLPAAITGIGTLAVGSNTLIATSGGGDFDHVGFNVGTNTQLDSIILTTYGGSSQSFTALQNGTVWTAGVGGAVNPAVTLGYTHFGPAAGGAGIGNNLLTNMSTAAGAVGFSVPIGSGVYNMLLQDTGGAVSYSLTFNVSSTIIPEPVSAGLLIVGLGCVSSIRRRCSRD